MAAETRDIIITRVFAAPRALVYETWTDPTYVAQWFGPRDFAIPACEMAVKPGGAYRILMCSPDGAQYPLHGVYHEVEPLERLVYTSSWADHPAEWQELLRQSTHEEPGDEALMTVTFAEEDGKTKVTIRILFLSVDDCQAMEALGTREGWAESLDRLEERLTGSPR